MSDTPEPLPYVSDLELGIQHNMSDALNQPDTVSLSSLQEDEEGYSEPDQYQRAGIDYRTSVDSLMALNGEQVFITEV